MKASVMEISMSECSFRCLELGSSWRLAGVCRVIYIHEDEGPSPPQPFMPKAYEINYSAAVLYRIHRKLGRHEGSLCLHFTQQIFVTFSMWHVVLKC